LCSGPFKMKTMASLLWVSLVAVGIVFGILLWSETVILPNQGVVGATAVVTPRSFSSHTKIAIVGAAGFVGSVLHERLAQDFLLNVTGFDRHKGSDAHFPVILMAALKIPDDLLHSFNVVVYLGGLTGRKACEMAYVERGSGCVYGCCEEFYLLASQMHVAFF
jgi:hypothetical protein